MKFFFDNFIFSFIPWISINFSGFSIYYWKMQCFLEWFDWKITCVGFYKQLNTWDKFLITLNTQKTALPVLLYLCGNNWSLVFTTSAGWVTIDAIMPAKAPQVNVSNELSSGVPSSDRQDTLIKHLFKVRHKAKTVHWQHTCISQNKKTEAVTEISHTWICSITPLFQSDRWRFSYIYTTLQGSPKTF